MIVGYISLCGPMGALPDNPVTPSVIVPIVCGFAIMMAFVLTFNVVLQPDTSAPDMRH
jgi:hypothetical protein